MPVVTIEMYEGRTTEQKQALVEAITEAMVEHADAPFDSLDVIIHDIPKENWGRKGKIGTLRED